MANKNREKKEKIVAGLKDKLGKSKGLVFTNYQGLTHKQLEGLKKAIKPMSAEVVIAKNTLLLRAIKDSSFNLQDSDLSAPTATVFLYDDPVEPLKQIAKLIKEVNLPTIKIGIIDGQKLSSEQVLKLSTLPSKDVLIARVIGQFKAPLFGLHRAFNWNLQKFVMTLKAIETKKGVN